MPVAMSLAKLQDLVTMVGWMELFLWLPALIGLAKALVAFGRFVSRWTHVAVNTRHVPAAPGGNWLLGHVFQLMNTCAWEKMYDWVVASPPMVRFRILHRTGIIVGDPWGLKRIFQTRFKAYDKDLDFSYNPFLPILGSGLVTANGNLWQKQRLLMAPAMRIDMLDAILPIAKRAVDRLAEKLNAEGARDGRVSCDIEEEFRLLTLQVIGEAILSLGPEECDRVFPDLYLPVMEESNRRVLAPWRYLYPFTVLQYNSKVRRLNNYIINIIRQRRKGHISGQVDKAHKGDILDRILKAVDERGEKWTPTIEVQLCYEIKTFLLAGHETSAAMLTWSVFELSKNRQAMSRVCEEAEKCLARPTVGADISRESVESMLWTLSCLKESLRKYSVVPVVTRDLNTEDELCGYKLPAGSWIICHLQRVHHLYKDPLEWKPERFMPGGEYDQFDEEIRPYMFVPFIQGPRNCLGQYFALLEARIVLGELCRRFSFELEDAETQGRTHPTVIPIGPVGGMKVVVRSRN